LSSDRDSSNNITISQKYLDKIVKLQQDQEKVRQEEYALLREHLGQMNILLSELVKVTSTGSTVAATKKIIPFHTGSQLVGQLVIPPSIDTPPPNPDDYPTQINIYAQNDNKPIQHMTLIDDGPGEIFFVVGYSETDVNRKEGHLNVNDQRELFNVYQIRMRSTLPETKFRLIEGIFRTGSFAPNTAANVVITPTVQSNEKIKQFSRKLDIADPVISITPPQTANFILPSFATPLPPGQTIQPVDTETGVPMPFIIPEGHIIEAFSLDVNFNTDFTIRFYVEIIPNRYTLFEIFPSSNRGIPLNFTVNMAFPFSTEFQIDPTGAPPRGRGLLFTITNDDPFNNMVGGADFNTILRKLR